VEGKTVPIPGLGPLRLRLVVLTRFLALRDRFPGFVKPVKHAQPGDQFEDGRPQLGLCECHFIPNGVVLWRDASRF
jgi:hypothetical protein